MTNPKDDRHKVMTLTAKDFEWDYERGRGKGGQKRNKTCSAVRCRHIPSGAIGWSEDGRSQLHNKRTAFERMTKTKEFQLWVKVAASKDATFDDVVDEMMQDKNLKIEYGVRT